MKEDALTVIPLSATGTLQAFAVSQVAPPGFPVPHAQGYIDLGDRGPRIFSLLTDLEGPSGLEIGGDMALKILNLGKDKENRLVVGYRFRPRKKEI